MGIEKKEFAINNHKIVLFLENSGEDQKINIEIDGENIDKEFGTWNLIDPKPEEDIKITEKIKNYGEIVFGLIKQFDGSNDFSSAYILSNIFFEKFIFLWDKIKAKKLLIHSLQIWRDVISWVSEWEEKNSFKIHKGTPYFFLGSNFLVEASNLDLGFMFLDLAMEEDKRFYKKINDVDAYRSTPAFLTLSLINDEKNALYEPFVKEITQIIEIEIKNYNEQYKKKINLNWFREKFLDNPHLDKEKFFFVYNLYNFLLFRKIINDSKAEETIFSEYKKLDLLFNFCLVVEVIFSYKYGKKTLLPNISEYTKQKYNLKETDLIEISNLNRLNNENATFIFSEAIDKILNNKIYDKSRKMIDKELNLFLLLWILRNYGGHRIIIDTIISKRYDEIVQKIIYSLFLICEKI